MATTVIQPASNNNSSNSWVGFLIGGIVLLVFIYLFFVYALPALRGVGGNGGTQINVPKSIDVKVQQTK